MVPKEWGFKSLDELALVERGKFSVRPRNDPRYFGGMIPFVQTGDISSAGTYLTKFKQTLNAEGVKVSKVFPQETILITIAANIGDTAITTFDVACPDSVVAIQPYKEKVDVFWLKSVLETKKNELDSQSTQNAQKNINLQVLKPLLIRTPPLPEQKMIAQILSTWDKAIATTEQLLANSQLLRKALMQQLLTGNQRFKGYDAKWISIKIGDILKEVKRPVNWSDDVDYKLLSVKRRSEGVVLREVINGSKILTKKMNVARKDDFLISKMQILHGAAGLVPECFDGFHVSDSYISLVSKDPGKLEVEFFSWYSQQKIMYHKAYLCSYGVHIEKMTFNFNMYLNEYVYIPSNVNEQKAIVEALNTASREIENIELQLKNLKLEKKAIMQQLLTGKRRVKVEAA
ncbi:restriction endonuclease subunit S [Serratia marcescens]|nr:restriction endonuclease subunit S [Serratia marcescens]MBH2817045.1 restriction endonuclease subunit S [Serratia marcescens]